MPYALTLSSLIERYSDPKYRVTVRRGDERLLEVKVEHSTPRFLRAPAYKTMQVYRLEVPLSGILLDSTDPTNVPDRSVDFLGYSRFAEECFNENQMNDRRLDLLHCAVGMSEEVGEIVGLIKKHVYHSRELDRGKVLSECGDLIWYFANFLRLMSLTLFDVLRGNQIKLRERYPNGRAKNFQLNPKRNEEQENSLILRGTSTPPTNS